MRILAFDSGIGGLGIVRCLRQDIPGACIDYLADTAVFPYGEQADDFLVARIVTLVGQAIARLRPDLVVIACNTASTLALGELRARHDVPFVGCVPPIKWAADLTQSRTIGLLATRATLTRSYLHDLRNRFAPDCTLVTYGARNLADLSELAFRGQQIPDQAISAEMAGLFSQPGGDAIDVVGLGCTHYTFLLDHFRRLGRPGLNWIDPAQAVSRQAARLAHRIGNITAKQQETGQAFFTALPEDIGAVLPGLRRMGYETARPFAERA
ncbi:glutamate racemase [Gluconacetobacter entanii]|uniref:Glutamate racemase n=1 Tax=Gluconacetobacter entanii TaxID=108528 RepID=A0A318QAA0_9PROT|nr:glutamate racemase [Gluconacetobacter entanii]MCE2577474.1 glutamate racemase [Komagataeibacter sp. FNDCR1]PYD62867.1 glutamate racemase [Gluconacetobacter entanii]